MAVSPPETTKPALGGFCRCFELVGRGNLNWLSKMMIYMPSLFFVFAWNTNWNTVPKNCVSLYRPFWREQDQ